MLFLNSLLAAEWFPVINNTIPYGVRVQWNVTSGQLQYTRSLIDQDKSGSKDLIVESNIHKDGKKYSVDDLLKHYHRVSNQKFLQSSKEELAELLTVPDFVENVAYNASELSTGIVMSNSEIIDVVVENLQNYDFQLIFRSITQNNHFAQTQIHERYPYLVSYLSELKTSKMMVRMLSAYVRGNSDVSTAFLSRVGVKWIFDQMYQHPSLRNNLRCLGYDLGTSLSDDALIGMFSGC